LAASRRMRPRRWRCPSDSSPLAACLSAESAASAAARASLAIRLDARREHWAVEGRAVAPVAVAALVLVDRDDWARPVAAVVPVGPAGSAKPVALASLAVAANYSAAAVGPADCCAEFGSDWPGATRAAGSRPAARPPAPARLRGLSAECEMNVDGQCRHGKGPGGKSARALCSHIAW
jgi:hypothetical protein